MTRRVPFTVRVAPVCHVSFSPVRALRCAVLCRAVQVLVARIQGPESPFVQYIANLPVGVSGVPMFFPREALEAIEYPPVVEQVCSNVLCCAVVGCAVVGCVGVCPADVRRQTCIQ